MLIFVDLLGASGATYRFRAWPEDGQSPTAGNFVVIGADRVTVQMVGVTNDLSKAMTYARESGETNELFVRLNVARATRQEEHADLVANYQPRTVFSDDN